ncbi:MAG TPA: spore coat protein U domain-containing protein [Castellaniella sp.]|uniref:spore coat protein U domain-containing protein n=1 Tax=Castellaniella sp. TaxID=1955812 RepID=UPI002F255F8B
MKTTQLLATSLSLVAGLTLLPGAANAAVSTATGTLGTTITITANCLVSTNNAAMNFGSNASTATTNAAASASFGVTCTNGTAYNVGLTPAATTTGGTPSTTGAGTMKNSNGSSIAYNLYQDSAHNTAWGSTVSTNTESGTGTGSSTTYNVYGLVAASALNVPAGIYTDTVAINVTY